MNKPQKKKTHKNQRRKYPPCENMVIPNNPVSPSWNREVDFELNAFLALWIQYMISHYENHECNRCGMIYIPECEDGCFHCPNCGLEHEL